MELKRYIQFLRQWLWLMVVFAAIGGVAAYFLSIQQPRIYASSTKVLVNQARAGVNNIPTMDDLRTRDRLATTYVELLTRRPLMEQVGANLELGIPIWQLIQSIDVTAIPDTEIIVVTAEHPEPAAAAAIANEVVKVFNEQAPELFSNPYAASVPVLNIVEEARPSAVPVRPTTQTNLILGAFLGILLAIGIGFLVNYYDDRVKSSAEVEALTGFSTLLAVAPIKGGAPTERLVTVANPRSTDAEAYQAFLGHIDLFADANPISTLVVTSGSSKEGKSTTAANLAVVLAQMGKRVILVDADLRVPTLHTLFRLGAETGLTTALSRPEGQPLSAHLFPTGIDNLLLMPSGAPPAKPVQLLGSQAMARLLEELKSQADLVIFDSPAMLPIVDAMLLMRLSDAAILVVRAGATRAEALARTSDLIGQSGINVLGVVLTGVQTPHGSYTTYFSQTGWRRKRYAGWQNSLFALRRDAGPAAPAGGVQAAGEPSEPPARARKRP